MKLSLTNPVYSLLPFETELPSFTLITGLNGSGKSQLLSAISTGQVMNDIAGPEEIQHFGPHMFRIASSSHESYEGFDSSATLADFLDRTALLNADIRSIWMEWGKSRGLDDSRLLNDTKLVYETMARAPTLEYFLRDNTAELSELEDLVKSLQEKSKLLGFAKQTGSFEIHRVLNNIQAHWGLPYYLLDSRQLREATTVNQPLFKVSLGAVFTKYRNDDLRNRLNRISYEDGESEIPPLSKEEFLDEKGPPPWDVINELLADLNVDARFEAPPIGSTNFYDPVMTGKDRTRFSPSQLSSGEEVILALATLGYAAADRRKIWTAPSLVLLDEVDAPLHPAMARTYLKVIREVLIDQFGMHVIATTHSPSTVAQSDLEHVYVMKKGQAGLTKITKETAVTVLTEGVPTLSVSISSRRQVFAESPVEAANLDRLYQILKPALHSEMSLQFIATGTKQANSGKSDVERIVGDLIDAGNKSVYGVIDWDTNNVSSERIKVIAAGRRYALENIILDPLILATYLYRKLDKKALPHYGLKDTLDVYSLKTLGESEWQAMADAVTEKVLGEKMGSVVACQYHGGMTINISEAYLQFNAHKLEDRVVCAYPMLESLKMSGSGALTAHMIENVLTQMPSLIPIEVEQVFLELLAA